MAETQHLRYWGNVFVPTIKCVADYLYSIHTHNHLRLSFVSEKELKRQGFIEQMSGVIIDPSS